MALGSPQCHAAVPRDSHIACVSLTVAKQGPPASRPVAKMAGELWVSIETWAVVAFVDITSTSHPPKKDAEKWIPIERMNIRVSASFLGLLTISSWMATIDLPGRSSFWMLLLASITQGPFSNTGSNCQFFFGIYMGERVRIYIYNMCVIVCK